MNGTGTSLATNECWDNTSVETVAALCTATTAAGTFVLAANSRDAALLVTVPPGRYTTLISGAHNTTGIAVVEFYEVP